MIEETPLQDRNGERTHVDGSFPPSYDALSGMLEANTRYWTRSMQGTSTETQAGCLVLMYLPENRSRYSMVEHRRF